MYDFLSSILGWLAEFARPYLEGLIIVLLASIIANIALYVRQWLQWHRSAFEDCINITLNTIVDGVLCIETVYEGDMRTIIPSAYARRVMKRAAGKTTRVDEFLHIADPIDDWIVNNLIRNSISKICGAEVLVACAQGNKDKEWLVFEKTFERNTPVRLQKVRVIVVQVSTLTAEGPRPAPAVVMRTDVSEHRSRIDTITAMYREFSRGDWSSGKRVSIPKKP